MKTALVAGGTGLVGSELIKTLIDDPIFDRILLVTRKSMNLDSPKIEEHILNFELLSEFNPKLPIDYVFCCLGTTIKKAGTKEKFRKVDYEYVVGLGKKAVEWETEKFLVVTALGANPKSKIFYNRVKGETEEALRTLKMKHLFIFRPSLLMGDRQESRAGEKTAINIYKVINPLFFGKLKKYKGIMAGQVAHSLVVTAKENNNQLQILESNEMQDL